MSKEIAINCPTCNENFNYYASDFRPFCCERCKMIDLGAWLTESYTIPSGSEQIRRDSDERTYH